jgi:hypothetical protein
MSARCVVTFLGLVLCVAGCKDDDKSTGENASTSESGSGGGHAHDEAGKPASAGKGGSSSGAAGSGGQAAAAPASPSPDPDYTKPEAWLCRPGHSDNCAVDLDTTVVRADGNTEREKFESRAEPPIDCFYVYPTVSADPSPNSDLDPGPEEKSVVRAQFARFASQCRLFAPMYRQVTLTSLRASLAGMTSTADRMLGYKDVLSAWKHYLEHDNNGRGVVLVGHSQGSSVLIQLLKDQLDKDQLDKRVITTILGGMNVLVPKDKLVGGTFQHIPVCKSADELGCVLVFASFRSTMPPGETSLFATSSDKSLVAACTNPAAIGGGSAELHSYFTKDGPGASSKPMGEWATGKTIDTPFVSTPGLVTAECKFGLSGSYLSITINGDSKDPRTDELSGDVVTNGEVSADWGLHLIDMHLTMGNLLDVVSAKVKAYQAK